MGDYLKNGTKIGTCGAAYYATKGQLESHRGDPEADYYLNPSNKCSFAFPFPEYDRKDVGAISNFHDGERVDFFFNFPAEGSHHRDIAFHSHPKGAPGINFFTPCCYSKEANVSKNTDTQTAIFRLNTQVYFEGTLHIGAECVYCGCDNIFSPEEAEIICQQIEKWIDNDPKRVLYYKEVAKRIRETYQAEAVL